MDEPVKEINLKPETWVENYGDQLFQFAVKRVLDVSKAEDLVQDTFIAALKSRKKFKGESSEKTWLFAILKNKIIDQFRKLKRSKKDDVDFTDPFLKDGLMYKHWDKEMGPSDWSSSFEKDEEAICFPSLFQAMANIVFECPLMILLIFSFGVSR